MKTNIIGVFLLICFSVSAQTELVLSDAFNKVSVGASCMAIKDISQQFSEKDFGNIEFEKRFQKIATSKPNFGYSNATIWLKINLQNISKKHWFLELDNPNIDLAECYFIQNNKVISHQKAGDSYDFSKYLIKDRNPIFEIENSGLSPQTFTIYLKLKNKEELSFPLVFWEEKELISHLAERNVFWGIFFGFILLIAIYNTFLWFSIQEKTYLFYVGYVLSFGFFQASLYGFGFQYLWGSSVFNEVAHVLFVGLTITFLILFSIYFLELFKFFPEHKKRFKILGIIWLITFPIMVFTFNESTNYFIVAITIFSFFLQFYFCFKLFRIKNRNVRYYLLATAFVTLAGIIVILKGFGFFFKGDFYLKLGSMIEIVLFSLALGDKYRQEHLEKERQQRIRDEISANLHDDLAASLSSLTMFSESNRRKAQKISSENEAVFRRISEKSREILNLVRENVWEMNPRNDTSEEWLDRMIKFASETLESKQIDLDLKISNEIRMYILPVDFRHDFYLFFKETINNIAKHSEAKKVKIELYLKNRNVYLEVFDDGKGFIVNEVKKGAGLLNLEKRAKRLNGKFEIKSEVGIGTTLKMNFKNY